jgi:hypothetical protein
MTAPTELYPSEVDPHDGVVSAIRQYLAVHSPAVADEPWQIAQFLYVRGYMEREPLEADVEAALEVLCVEAPESEVAAALESLRIEGEVLA